MSRQLYLIDSIRQVLRVPHDWLKIHSGWYNRWHQHPHRSIHHRHIALGSGITGLTAVAVSITKYLATLGLLASLTINPSILLAASQTWTSQADWQTWTLSNTTATDNPGSVQLSATAGDGSWSDQADAPLASYTSVWPFDTTNVWFGVDIQPEVKYFNGTTYSSQALPAPATINAFWGASADDVWAFGNDGVTYHYNGTAWSTPGDAPAIATDLLVAWGTSASDIWVAGASGWLAHYNGTIWDEQQLADTPNLRAIVGFATDDIWAAGDDGASGKVYRYDGATWEDKTSMSNFSGGLITGFWGTSDSSLWVIAGTIQNGTYDHGTGLGSWSPEMFDWTDNSCTRTGNLWGSGASDIWMPCKAGTVLHYVGVVGGWQPVATPAGTVWGVSGTSSTDVWGYTNVEDIYRFTSSSVYESSGTANITYTPSAGQINDWSGATPSTTTPTNTTATLEYSHDNATWQSDIGNVPSSESLYIRASLATTDTSVTPTLDALSVSYDAITATVSAPNGGENILFNDTGDTTTISWTATGTAGVDHIHLQYSTNSGSTWSDISGATSLSAVTTSYAWDMPDTSSSTVQIKVILENATNTELDSDTSNADFTLTYDTTDPTFSSITAVSNNADTSIGKSGDIVTLTFTASETLLANPTVTIGTKAMTYSTNVGLDYTYTRTLDGTETAGSSAIAISGSDSAGNAGTGSGSFTLDFTNPSIAITSPSATGTYSTGSSSIEIAGTASDNNILSSVTSSVVGAVTGTTSWSQTVSLTIGSNSITYTATDSAGNTNTANIIITRTDNAGPGFNFITGTSNNDDTSIAKVGDVVTITFTASEALLANPTVTLGGQTVTYASNVGLDYTYTRTITGSEAEGLATIAISGNDLDSNAGTGSGSFTLDFTNPTFSSITAVSNNADTSIGKSGDIVTLTFTASETLLANPTVTIGTKAMTYSTNAGLDYTYTRTLDGTETAGSSAIAISGSDSAGNAGTGSGSFTLDFTNPTFSSITAVSNNADTSIGKSGDIVTLTFTASETLLANPTVTIGTKAMTYSTNAGLDYTYTRTLDGTETAGSSAIAISGSDSAGNAGTGSGSFTLDFTNPSIAITSPSATGTYSTTDNSVAVSGTASDNVTLSSVTSSVAGGVTGTTSWSQTVSLAIGSNSITYTATDSAGNTNTANIVITRTNPSPSFSSISGSSNNNNSRNIAKSGDIVTITFTASEALLANPTVTLGGQTVTYSSNSGLNYTYTRTITGTETEGSSVINITAQDLDGASGSGTGSFLLDFTDPSISISYPDSSSYTTRDSNQYISGTASDNIGLRDVSSSVDRTVSGTSVWFQTVPLVEGSNSVIFTASDNAGNTKTASFTVTRDITAPDHPTGFQISTCIITACSFTWDVSTTTDTAGYLIVARHNNDFTVPTNGINYSYIDNQNLGGLSYTWIDNKNTTTGTSASLVRIVPYYFAIYAFDEVYNYSDHAVTTDASIGIVTAPTATTTPVAPTSTSTPIPTPIPTLAPIPTPTLAPTSAPTPLKQPRPELGKSQAPTFITNPITQPSAGILAVIVTALSALVVLGTVGTIVNFTVNRLLELISRVTGSMTNGLHYFALAKYQEQNIGRVIDHHSRHPIKDAAVTLINARNKAIINVQPTDDLGRYQFMVESGQAYLVQVEHPKYETVRQVLWNNPHRLFKLGLKLEHNERRLIGRRRLTRIFNILDSFRLLLLICGTAATYILGLAGITLTVKILMAYYVFAWMLEAYVRTKPRPYGVVTDSVSRQPLDLVVVRIFSTGDKLIRTIVTDQRGRFRTLMTPGYYKMTFTKIGWQPLTEQKYIGRSVQFLRIDVNLIKYPPSTSTF